MARSSNLPPVERSPEMLLAAYYLARCGVFNGVGSAAPPVALGAETWKSAYDQFFDALSDGRDPSQFRNSLKNARDSFDRLFDNGRVEWNSASNPLPLSFQTVHDQWAKRNDAELEAHVLSLLPAHEVQEDSTYTAIEARDEGGAKVFTSVRRERDLALHNEAIGLHGTTCMACGFSFEATYGEWGAGFIEVHHRTPLSEAGLRSTNPKTDLIVLCSSRHRMVHRQRGICLSLKELRRLVQR